MDEQIKVLLSMGYRPMDADRYAKPIGYHILVFYLNEQKIVQYFLGKEDILVFKADTFCPSYDPDLLSFLKEFETHTRFDTPSNGCFEFLSMAEQLAVSP